MVGEPRKPSGFAMLARVLSPAEESRTQVSELDDAWRPRERANPGSTWTVWGRLPARRLSAPGALAFALRREAAIHRMRREFPGGAVRRLHRLYPAEHRRSGGILRRVLLHGAAVEIAVGHGLRPTYEDVLIEAEIDNSRPQLAASRDGSVRIAGMLGDSPVILRLGIADTATDPARNAAALRALQARGVPLVPTLVREGRRGGIAWAVESRLRGKSLGRLSSSHWDQAIDFLTHLVTTEIPVGAVRDQANILAGILPARSEALVSAGHSLAAVLARLPSALQHGDFFSDNLLFRGSWLTGVVDWNSWAAGGCPGVDLFELYATDRRRRKPAEFASILTEEFWRSRDFLDRTDAYWRRIGVAPTPETLRSVASAWWFASLTALLERPDRRALLGQPAWVAREVDQVLAWLEAGRA
jgi:Phosphotransferase enzyme family